MVGGKANKNMEARYWTLVSWQREEQNYHVNSIIRICRTLPSTKEQAQLQGSHNVKCDKKNGGEEEGLAKRISRA